MGKVNRRDERTGQKEEEQRRGNEWFEKGRER